MNSRDNLIFRGTLGIDKSVVAVFPVLIFMGHPGQALILSALIIGAYALTESVIKRLMNEFPDYLRRISWVAWILFLALAAAQWIPLAAIAVVSLIFLSEEPEFKVPRKKKKKKSIWYSHALRFAVLAFMMIGIHEAGARTVFIDQPVHPGLTLIILAFFAALLQRAGIGKSTDSKIVFTSRGES